MEYPPVYQGTIEEIRVPEIINNLSRRKETGTLYLKRQHLEKILYFEEGKIVFAASNDPDERLGVLLLRQNKVTYRQLEECAPKVDSSKRLGTVFVLDGIIQPNDLYQAVIDQIKEIVYGAFDWDNGKFDFHPGPLSQKEVITLNLSAPDLIMNGMQRVWRWSWVRQALPALDIVYRKREGWTPVVRKMTLTREMEAILDLFDRPRTLEEVLQISTLSNFETCRLMWTFMILGIIEEILVAPTWTAEPEGIPTLVITQSTQEMPAEPKTVPVEMPVVPEGPTLKMEMREQPAEGEQILPFEVEVEIEEPAPAAAKEEEPPIERQAPPAKEQAPPAEEQLPAVQEPAPHVKESLSTAEGASQATEKAQAGTLPSDDLEELLLEPVPFSELSFSDLSELTETEKAVERVVKEESPALQAWETEIQPQLKEFNELHRYIFEMVTLEQANVTNTFLSKAFKKASVKFPLVFEGVSMNEFGEFAEPVLLANIQGNLVQDYQTALDFLINEERSMINLFLEMKRATAIENGVKRILERRNRALT
ncbi:DUF4388 domain-containing protein [bacterium]|nr:DUF4388 domain-containing protein [bacterium]MCI0605874.1 DUF4388 domain-containing protein [bacterium]